MSKWKLVPVEPVEPDEAMLEAGAKAAWELGGAEYSGAAILGPWEQTDDLTRKRGKRMFAFGWPAMLSASPAAPDVVGVLEDILDDMRDGFCVCPAAKEQVVTLLAQLKGEKP